MLLQSRTWVLSAALGIAFLLDALFLYVGQESTQRIMGSMGPTGLSAWTFSLESTNDLQTLVFGFVAVIGADIVAGEFSSGTIHMLLTQSVSRSEVLASKYFAALLFSFFTALFTLGLSILIGGVFFGFGGATVPQIYMGTNHTLHQMWMLGYLLMQYGFLSIQIVVTITIAFMISTVFRNRAFSATTAILATLVGPTLAVSLRGYSWDKFILFANSDLSQYVIDGPVLHGMTLRFSVSVLFGYFIVMIGTAWVTFLKRDVSYT